MRSCVVLSILTAACGSSKARPRDAAVGDGVQDAIGADAAVDAPRLPACANPASGTTITFRRIGGTTTVGGPAVLATSPPNDPRLFVLELSGHIRIFENEVMTADPFLDLSAGAGGPVSVRGEQGLLGLAFHPQYATNGLFFLYYTTGQVATSNLRDVIARCSVSATDPDRADPASCVEIWSVPDPAENHNGGMMEFGSDGLLYIGTGDGGGTGNRARALDPMSTFGKMLRIDVDHKASGKEYGIPSDNPYVAGGGAPEVWMSGMRNPWRWSFDRANGTMWIADVGADAVEEVDVLAPSEQKAANLGWGMYEGNNCYTPPCNPAGMTFPKDQRLHADGWHAIIGGQVYRGTCYPDIVGTYYYSDLNSGVFVAAHLDPSGTYTSTQLQGTFPTAATSLHADARGELYLTTFRGTVWHLEAGP
jgi:glucose/arabinose dehydrogenase